MTPSGKAKANSNWIDLGAWITSTDGSLHRSLTVQKQTEWLSICVRGTRMGWGTRCGGSSGMGVVIAENPTGECTRGWCLSKAGIDKLQHQWTTMQLWKEGVSQREWLWTQVLDSSLRQRGKFQKSVIMQSHLLSFITYTFGKYVSWLLLETKIWESF